MVLTKKDEKIADNLCQKYNFSFLNNMFCVKNVQRLRYKVKEKNNQTESTVYSQ